MCLLVGLLLVACHPDTATPDAALYTAALAEHASYNDAIARCTAIDREALRGDCRLSVMEGWARLDTEGCAQITAPLWHDECLFALSETLWETSQPTESLALCDQTRFSTECVFHILQRIAQEGAVTGDPRPAAARLDPILAAQQDHDRATTTHRFWWLWFREAATRRRVVDERDCDRLTDPQPCQAGLRRYLRKDLHARASPSAEGIAATCATPLRPIWAAGPLLEDIVTRWQAQSCTGPETAAQTAGPPSTH